MSKTTKIETVPAPLRNDSERIQFSFEYWCEKGKFGRKRFEKQRQESLYDSMIKKLREYTEFDLTASEFAQKYLSEMAEGKKFPPADSYPEVPEDLLADSSKYYKFRTSIKFRIGGYLSEVDNIFYIRWVAPHHD